MLEINIFLNTGELPNLFARAQTSTSSGIEFAKSPGGRRGATDPNPESTSSGRITFVVESPQASMHAWWRQYEARQRRTGTRSIPAAPSTGTCRWTSSSVWRAALLFESPGPSTDMVRLFTESPPNLSKVHLEVARESRRSSVERLLSARLNTGSSAFDVGFDSRV